MAILFTKYNYKGKYKYNLSDNKYFDIKKSRISILILLYLPRNKAKKQHMQILNVSIYCNQKYIAQQMTSHIISNKSYILSFRMR